MFFAYFPANVTFEGLLADLHAAAVNNPGEIRHQSHHKSLMLFLPGFNWSCSPSVTELELVTLDWVSQMFGLSDAFRTTSSKGGGIILNSASEVAITVAVAARERALARLELEETKLGEACESSDMTESAAWRGKATSRLIMYGTTQTHSIGVKAAMILGLSFRAIEVRVEDDYALRAEALRQALEEDTAKGLLPFMLIATIGTTSSGAVDNLDEIERVAAQYPQLWIHIDSAYAGVALALPEMREKCYLDAINRYVDSFSTNLHKWGLVQFDCATLHVRDRAALSNALTITPEFLRTKHGDAGSVLDLRNMQLSLGRRFRSLKIWFVLRSYGQKGFRKHLRASMELSDYFNELLRTNDVPFHIVVPPQWSLTVFRIEVKNTSPEAIDGINRLFWDVLQSRNHTLLLTQTLLPGIGFCIRMAIGSPQTRKEDIEKAFKVLCDCADEVLSQS